MVHWRQPRHPSEPVIKQFSLACLVMLILQACSSSTGGDRAPTRVPSNLEKLPDPVVRVVRRSKSGNRSTYKVLGRTYKLLPRAEGYRATGNASWYGTKFHGRQTASGERYDMYRLSAAHKHLPIPCFARITNLENNRSTIVRVNDRGPFHDDRIVDLSYAAAVKLGFAHKGTARVRMEVVTPASLARSTKPLKRKKTSAAHIYLQVGAFSELKSALVLKDQLQTMLGQIIEITNGTDKLFRVSIGPVEHMREARRIQALLVSADFASPLIVRH